MQEQERYLKLGELPSDFVSIDANTEWRIQSASKAIAVCEDGLANVLTDRLNRHLVDTDLFNVEVAVQSDDLIRHRFDRNGGRTDRTDGLDDLDGTALGMFMGIERYSYDDRSHLFYVLKTAPQGRMGEYQFVYAPVDSSEIVMKDEENIVTANVFEDTIETFGDRELLNDAHSFLTRIHEFDDESSSEYALVGKLAAKMFKHEKVRGNAALIDAVCQMIRTVCVSNETIELRGYSTTQAEDDRFVLNKVEIKGSIVDVHIARNFEFSRDKKTIKDTRTWQPVLVVRGFKTDEITQMPLKCIEGLSLYPDEAEFCARSIDKFRAFYLKGK